MYKTFDEAMNAMLANDDLDAAGGGQIIKEGSGFSYKLHGQPEAEGEVLIEINPSSTPEVKWRVFRVTKEGSQAYEAYITNPENGLLSGR